MSDFAVIVHGKVLAGTRKNNETFPDAAVKVIFQNHIPVSENEEIIIISKPYNTHACKSGAIITYRISDEHPKSVAYFDNISLLKRAIDEVFKEVVVDA